MASKHTGQRDLFEHRPAWEEDDRRHGTVATVVLPDGVDKPLDYLVPERLVGEVEPGRRVVVPLGRADRPRIAYCVACRSGELTAVPLKEVVSVEDPAPLLSPRMLELTAWMAERWMARHGEVLEAVLPAGVRLSRGGRRDPLLVASGTTPPGRRTVAQGRVLEAAAQPSTAAELAARAGCGRTVIARLVEAGALVEAGSRERPLRRAAPRPVAADTPHPELSPAQQGALDAILDPLRAGRHETILLFGVTGSGKTEVYLRAVEETLRQGKQAIVLVPEISLTPQTCDRFRARFGAVAVLHSHLTPAERHAEWREIAAGRVGVVVGARSAVFAPTPRLGLVVIDEEHETSFKQATAPRYHARDVAEWIARHVGVPLVLGSATPSLETFARCLDGGWRMCRLPERVGGSRLPPVITVDLRELRGRGGALSPRLVAGIKWALDAGGQVMLLLNRRGFATHVQCRACGHDSRCAQCDLALTLHEPGHRGVCHGCGLVTRVPADCPACGAPGLAHRGTGTQRLEEQVRSAFPGLRVARMDTDTMRERGSHERTLDAFRAREIDLLVGTQMIAKGLDFPDVMLVGVVHADAALHLADFRAAERTCQLVTQVSGRSGRGAAGGRVVVQTCTPDHPAIRAAAAHDYEAFVRHELPVRRALLYPPFGAIVRIVVRSARDEAAEAWAETVAAALRGAATGAAGAGIRVLGPAPAPITRLRDQFRWHLQLHGPDGPGLRGMLRAAVAGLKTPDGVAWIVDVDPVEML